MVSVVSSKSERERLDFFLANCCLLGVRLVVSLYCKGVSIHTSTKVCVHTTTTLSVPETLHLLHCPLHHSHLPTPLLCLLGARFSTGESC